MKKKKNHRAVFSAGNQPKAERLKFLSTKISDPVILQGWQGINSAPWFECCQCSVTLQQWESQALLNSRLLSLNAEFCVPGPRAQYPGEVLCCSALSISPRAPGRWRQSCSVLAEAVIPQQPQAQPCQPLPSWNPPAIKLKRGNKNYYPCVKGRGGNGVWLCGSRERKLGILLVWLWIDETFSSRELWDCKSWS